MSNLAKKINKITDSNNRFIFSLRGTSYKKFKWLFIWYLVIVGHAAIIMPSMVQAFSLEKERQGSEIEVRSLYFNVISTEDFVKGLSVNPPPDVMTVCEKKKPEIVSCVNILVPSSNQKSGTNADQRSDDSR